MHDKPDATCYIPRYSYCLPTQGRAVTDAERIEAQLIEGGYERSGQGWTRGAPSMTNPAVFVHPDGTWSTFDGLITVNYTADGQAESIEW